MENTIFKGLNKYLNKYLVFCFSCSCYIWYSTVLLKIRPRLGVNVIIDSLKLGLFSHHSLVQKVSPVAIN